jgi:hypothetical protein
VRDRSLPYDLLIFAEAFEGLLLRGKSTSILSTLRDRLELLIGRFPDDPRWFDNLSEMRSRIVHGNAPVKRPDLMASANPQVRKMLEEMFGAEWEATAALLALLQDLVSKDAHSYDF